MKNRFFYKMFLSSFFWSGEAQRSGTHPGEPKNNDFFSAKKCPIFFDPIFWYFFLILDVSMFFSIVLDARPHLRYWNPSIKPETSSNAYFDRLPCKFSRFWAPLQGNRTFSRQVQFYCSGAQNHENWLGSLSMAFFHGKSESSSKFQYIIFKYRCHDIG